MLTYNETMEILGEVQFYDWTFFVSSEGASDGGLENAWMQVRFDAPDLVTGDAEAQHGRKWLLSPHMTKSEIVTTAFKAVITAVEHEARELFRYKGRAIFGPHFNVDTLVEFARSRDNLDMRTGAWVKSPQSPQQGGTA